MGWKAKLEEMVNGYDSKISALQSQMGSLQDKARDIEEQISALDTTKLLNKNSTIQVLEAKRAVLALALGGTCTIHYGHGFGTSNLTSWYIYYHGDSFLNPYPRIVYRYGGAGWDNNPTIKCLVEEFLFIDDYIKVSLNTGLYGLDGMLDLVRSSVDKLEDMIHKFDTAKRRLESFVKSGVSGCLINPSL